MYKKRGMVYIDSTTSCFLYFIKVENIFYPIVFRVICVDTYCIKNMAHIGSILINCEE